MNQCPRCKKYILIGYPYCEDCMYDFEERSVSLEDSNNVLCINHKEKLAKFDHSLPICESCLEDAAISSANNFGIPDCSYCGICGQKFDSREAILKHLNANPKGECADA